MDALKNAKQKAIELGWDIDIDFKKGNTKRRLTLNEKNIGDLFTIHVDKQQNSLVLYEEETMFLTEDDYLELFSVQLAFWKAYCMEMNIPLIEVSNKLRLFSDPSLKGMNARKFIMEQKFLPPKDNHYCFIEVEQGILNQCDEIYSLINAISSDFKKIENSLVIAPCHHLNRYTYAGLTFFVSLFNEGWDVTILFSHHEHFTIVDRMSDSRIRFKKERLKNEFENFLNAIYKKNRLKALFK